VEDYLLMECIVDNLVRGKVILPSDSWKWTAKGTQFYCADFFRAETGHVISFHIIVINEKHVITKRAFIHQAQYFNINPARILGECKV
jgi:hypothetical protein